ncbi:MAG: hypothetical protein ACRC33_26230 [Gemmataceae bacterium]
MIDDALKAKLKGLTTPLELCDEKGHILARVNPVFDPALYEIVGEEATPEELAALLRYDGPTYSTDEVRALLRKP